MLKRLHFRTVATVLAALAGGLMAGNAAASRSEPSADRGPAPRIIALPPAPPDAAAAPPAMRFAGNTSSNSSRNSSRNSSSNSSSNNDDHRSTWSSWRYDDHYNVYDHSWRSDDRGPYRRRYKDRRGRDDDDD
jgi:hypothetical protein